jgi:hypothetical protein
VKTIRGHAGSLFERQHFKSGEIDRICMQELRTASLYPSTPQPIRIERFIEKRFGISPTYADLPDGVLGFTLFGSAGVKEIVVSSDLDAAEGTPNERHLRSTLAHEAGHGLLHAHLFYLGTKPISLFEEPDTSPTILCRDVAGEALQRRNYDGRWWEYQANQAIGGLLMPRQLVYATLQAFAIPVGPFGQIVVADDKRELAIRDLASTFDVNPIVVRIRLADILGSGNERQLRL